ncbi:hypothetical protein HDZ31DRAFT_80623 [Schizophyllum fasciatum]
MPIASSTMSSDSSLRERRRVALVVKTSRNDLETRGRDRARRALANSRAPTASRSTRPPKAPLAPTPAPLYHAHELMPYLHIGLHDLDPTSTRIPGPYVHGPAPTHIVKLTYAPERGATLHADTAADAHILTVRVPPRAPRLSHRQRALVADFLALALPYHSAACPPPTPMRTLVADAARVVVCAPRGESAVGYVDPAPARLVLAAVVAYVASISGNPERVVMPQIVEDAETPKVWRKAWTSL